MVGHLDWQKESHLAGHLDLPKAWTKVVLKVWMLECLRVAPRVAWSGSRLVHKLAELWVALWEQKMATMLVAQMVDTLVDLTVDSWVGLSVD